MSDKKKNDSKKLSATGETENAANVEQINDKFPVLNDLKILRQLRRRGVKFVLIGGTAAKLHGLNVPETVDVDIAPEMSAANLERLAAFFEAEDARLVTAEENGTWFSRWPVENWMQYSTLHLVTPNGLLDVVFRPAGTQNGYSDLAPQSETIAIEGETVRIISVEQWVSLKEAAKRPKDLDHLRQHFGN